MPILKKDNAQMTAVRQGVERRLVHASNLMMVVIDFKNGPWPEPEPLHHHVHEQATYVAEGEIIFFCEDEKEQKLKTGDMFWVPSNKKHGIQLLSETAKLIDSFNPIREDFIKK
jgi:quercetin dioxygenase-like cupin family protein